MSHDKIRQSLIENEGTKLEFKEQVPIAYRIARTICAFANTKGGQILVGVADNKEIIGVMDIARAKERLLDAAKFHCEPPIPISFKSYEENFLEVLVVQVRESARKPHQAINHNGLLKTYIRVKDQTVMASKMVERILANEILEDVKPKRKLDSKEQAVLTFLQRRDQITLKRYMTLVNISQRRARRLLTNMVKDGFLRIHTHQKEDYYTLS